MTSPELPCNMRDRLVDELLCTSPITAGFGILVEHEVTNEAFTASRGEYEALCGCVFIPAPLVAPPGRPCQACLDVRTAARRAAAARRRPCHRRVGLLRRLVPLGKRQRTSTEKDITQWALFHGPVPGRSLWRTKWIIWVIRATGMRAVNERTGKHTEARPGPAGSVDVRSAAA